MFTFLKKLFGFKTECCCKHCNCQESKMIKADFIPYPNIEKVYNRCGFDIRVPMDIAGELDAKGYCISLTKYKGQPSCVQLSKAVEGKSKYVGTLKNFMHVESFKDGNVCNFNYSNLIYKKEGENK